MPWDDRLLTGCECDAGVPCPDCNDGPDHWEVGGRPDDPPDFVALTTRDEAEA